MIISMSTVVQKGVKCVWLTRRQFVSFIKDKKDLNDAQAEQEWFRELAEGKKDGKVSEDEKEILYPVEKYIVSFDETSKRDELQMGCKDKKNPHASDIAEQLGSMGTDHQDYNDDFFTKDLGLKAGMLHNSGGSFTESTAPTVEQKKAEELEKAAKEKKKQEAQEKNVLNGKVKSFEQAAVFSKLLPELKTSVEKVEKRSNEVIGNADTLIEQVKADTEAMGKFGNALATLEKRVACLKSAAKASTGAAGSAIMNQHDDEWKNFINDPDFKARFKAAKGLEPYKEVYTVESMSALFHFAENPTADSHEAVKQLKRTFKTKVDCFRSLANKVAEQESRLKHLFTKMRQDKVNVLAVERMKQEEDSKKANAKAAAKAMAKKQPNKPRQYSVLDKATVMPRDVTTKTTTEFVQLKKPLLEPVLMPDLQWSVPEILSKGLADFIEQDFKTSRSYTSSGRGAQLVSDALGTALNKEFQHVLGVDGEKLLARLDRNERLYLQTPWYFGYSASMHCAGPEFAMVGSLKYMLSGDRMCVLAPFNRVEAVLVESLQASGEPSDEISPQQVCDFLSEATELSLAKMDSFAVRCRASAGSLLFVPWGWILVERTINSDIVTGFRWLLVSDELSSAFTALALRVLPKDGDKAKSNSAVAFLQRICSLLNEGHRPGAASGSNSGQPAALSLQDKLVVKLENAARPVRKRPAPEPVEAKKEIDVNTGKRLREDKKEADKKRDKFCRIK